METVTPEQTFDEPIATGVPAAADFEPL
ncbi:MAG: hypothetical protein QOF29_3473, partial [bacterium]